MSPFEKKRRFGLKLSVAEGSSATIHITLTGGFFLTGLALYLGASALVIGLLAAVPALAAAFGFLSAYLINRLGERRRLTAVTAGVGRGLFLAPALLLYFYDRAHFSVGALVGTVTLYNVLLTISGNAWMSWMSDLVPTAERGRYFAWRNTVTSVVGMASAYPAGKLLDSFRTRGRTSEGFILILGIALLASCVSVILLWRQPEPSLDRPKQSLRELVRAPLGDRNFRNFLGFVGFWYLTSGVAGPFFGAHLLSNLKLSYSACAVYGVLAGLTSLGFQPFWGRIVDRHKCRPVLGSNLLLAGFLPWLWLFATPRFLLPIWLDALLTGVFWTGINLALFNLVLALAVREEAKESYFALFSFVTGVAGFLSALIGGFIASRLQRFELHFLGQRLANFHVLFVIAGLARFISVSFLNRVHEPEAYSSLYVLELAGNYALRRLSLGKDLILDTLRLTRPRPPQE